MLRPLVVCVLAALTTASFATPAPRIDPRVAAATTWIHAMVLANGKLPTPDAKHPWKVVFDGKGASPSPACSKLRTATMTTEPEAKLLATCLQAALHELQLDPPTLPDRAISEAPVRWLKDRFQPALAAQISVPAGGKLFGRLFDRSTKTAQEGSGVALQIYVVVDIDNRVTAVYAYAGSWSYPV